MLRACSAVVEAETPYPIPLALAFLCSSQVRVNALRGSRTLTRSTVDLLAAAAGGTSATASNAGSPRAGGRGDASGSAEVDATTIFDRNLRGDGSSSEVVGTTSGSRTTAIGRPTRVSHGHAATVGAVNYGGSAATATATAAARGAATIDGSLLQEVDYNTAAPRETMMRSGAKLSDADAAAAAVAESNAAAAAAAEAAAELARQRDPLWKYRQQVGD